MNDRRNRKSIYGNRIPGRACVWICLLLVVLNLISPAGSVFCDIYKWTDENGVVHFSNTTIEDSDLWQKERELPPETEKEKKFDELTFNEPLTSSESKVNSDFFPEGGIFWKIVTPSGKTNYIMGTVHTEDPRIVMLPDHFYRIFEQSKSFTMETILDPEAVLHLSSSMLYMDGNNLQHVIGPDLFNDVLRAASIRGIPENGLKLMKPWAVMAILSMPETRTGQFLDLVLYENAVSMGKKIHELETTQEQVSVFSDMSDYEQTELLRSTLKQLDTLGDMNEKIIGLYLNDDLSGIANLASEYNDAGGNRDVSDKFMDRINDQRNIRMVKRMASILEEGSGFIAVGALHLTGENGILKLLKEKGCELTHVPR